MNEDIKPYAPNTAVLPSEKFQSAPARLASDHAFQERYMSSNDAVRAGAIKSMSDAHDLASRRQYSQPNQAQSNDAQAKIKGLMADKVFMSRYLSDDPKTRAGAIAEMSRLQHAAFGDTPSHDETYDRPATLNAQKRVADKVEYDKLFSPSGKK